MNMDQMTLPLHPAQYEIYIDQVLHFEAPHYNIGLYIKLAGSLNKEKFIEAVSSSPVLFDVFKMRFDLEDLDPICYFDDNYNKLEVAEVDFSHLNSPENEAKAWMQNQFNCPFVLRKENPLFEHVLIKIASDHHWFFFRYHHLITDAYGFVVWVNYLSRKYKSLLKEDNFQFDYPSYRVEAIKAWEYRNSDNYELIGNYWKEKIREKPESFLRKNTSFAKERTKKSGNYYLNISKEQRNIIDAVMGGTKSNLHQLTVAALLIYFAKISGHTEIIFGIPVHKRGQGKLRSILGMFSGVLPFQGVYNKDIKLTDLLKEIASSRKADYPYENYLIGDLIRSLKINASENILYDVLINYVPFNFELDFGEEIESTIFWQKSEYENTPLQVSWRDYSNTQPLELALHYSYDYFTPEEIELLAKRIIFILEQFPKALSGNLADIKILPDEECQLMEGFNGATFEFPQDKSIVDLFEEQAERTPDDIAIVFHEEHLSYKEFNERSNQVAHYLRSKGVKEETLVPILISRSVEMMVGIFGILKAGGAYVPIDPEYPIERISFMLQDTSALLVVCSKESRSKLPVAEEKEVIELDSEWCNINQHCKKNIPTSASSRHLAYVIYTSGSTGTPKGVMIEHRSLVASTLSRKLYYESLRSVFLASSFSFDSSVAVIFGTLLTGGRLIICEDHLPKDVDFFRELLRKVDTILCVPSYYRLLLEEGLVENSCLSKVILGGEEVSEQIVSAHYTKTNDVLLYNEYGPTECTVWASVAKIKSIASNVTIGAPIHNTSIYIVGWEGNLMPVGVAGEICISGDGLARGYLNNEELSKQKFVSNPFNKKSVELLYKTGDLGRWLPGGNIEFLGRVDNQIKIRGYRIELGEVESVLERCDQVTQAVVLAAEDKKGEKRLVGYVVPQNNGLDREALNQYLKNMLPSYMIPALWVSLEQLPLTSNGKIDRKSLRDIEVSEVLTEFYEAPKNEVQAKLCIIWQEVFNVEKVGIHDNFFTLGGDSLLSIKIVSRGRRLGYSLQARDLFLYQSIEKLSRAIATQSALSPAGEQNLEKEVLPINTTYKSLIPIKTVGDKIPLYIVCGGGGTVFKFKKFIDMLDTDQPVFVLQQPAERKDLDEFPDDINGIAARYVAEILMQNPTGPYALSGHCIGGIVVFEMAKQMGALGKKVDLLAVFDTIISEKTEIGRPSMFRNLNYSHNIVKMFFLKLYIKLHFETFLLRKHTKHAISYKIDAIKSLIYKIFPFINNEKEDVELEVFTEMRDTFASAYKSYELTPCNTDIIVFYAKDHHLFLDEDYNIKYGRFELSDSVKNRWKSYVRKATIYEVEGEHSTMFDSKYGGKDLAKKLQQHLNKCSKIF
jgi:amino acid adenylation domain-containing protein